MSSKILITGAAGFIGGSIVADFLASKSPFFQKENIVAAVRSEEQAQMLAKLGVRVLQLDLRDEAAVIESVVGAKVRIIIHCASSISPEIAGNLITALGKQREVCGEETFFIHTSGDSAFHERTGWMHGKIKDSGPMFELEKQLAGSFSIRETDVAVTEQAKIKGVTSFIVIPPMVYGIGTGPWNQLSILLPVVVQASIRDKLVHKFGEDARLSGVHVSDFTSFYRRIVEKILRKEPLASGEQGYYFAKGHDFIWWETLDRLAAALKARGLVDDGKAHVWPSSEAAAESLGVPAAFVQALWNSNANVIAENKSKLGWEPAWTRERLLENIDDEIDAVLELGTAKSSLIGSLWEASRS